MSRRRRAEKRVVPPDPKYGSPEVARFINKTMQRGKKTVAQRIVYDALAQVEKETRQNGLAVFAQALKNVTPLVEVKPRRVGGATYQVPLEVPQARGESLAMRWILTAARARKGMPMRQKLALELTLPDRNVRLNAAMNTLPVVGRGEESKILAQSPSLFGFQRALDTATVVTLDEASPAWQQWELALGHLTEEQTKVQTAKAGVTP